MRSSRWETRGWTEKCEERFRDLHDAGHAVVLVSHDPKSVCTHWDRALLLNGGRVVVGGDGTEVAEAYIERLTSVSAKGVVLDAFDE